jgi:hypothetical protein
LFRPSNTFALVHPNKNEQEQRDEGEEQEEGNEHDPDSQLDYLCFVSLSFICTLATASFIIINTFPARNSVPELYPQLLALPIARHPLFPGFYKVVVIRNPAVVSAVKETMKRCQPYLGAFLLKDKNTGSDVITDLNQIHHLGVFAQIPSVFCCRLALRFGWERAGEKTGGRPYGRSLPTSKDLDY